MVEFVLLEADTCHDIPNVDKLVVKEGDIVGNNYKVAMVYPHASEKCNKNTIVEFPIDSLWVTLEACQRQVPMDSILLNDQICYNLGVYKGDIVELEFLSQILQLKCQIQSEGESKESKAYINSLLYSNLSLRGIHMMKLTPRNGLTRNKSHVHHPSAESIILTRVVCPEFIKRGNVDYSEYIQKQLMQTETIFNGMIISVKIDELKETIKKCASDWSIEKFADVESCEYQIYFKVTQIEPNYSSTGFHKINSKTKIYQKGILSSKIPYYVADVKPMPEIFFKVLDELNNYLNMKKPCLISLNGKKGIGKKTFVENLARRLFVPLFELDCIVFKDGAINNQTINKISEKLSELSNRGPCIINVTNLSKIALKEEKSIDTEELISIIYEELELLLIESKDVVIFIVEEEKNKIEDYLSLCCEVVELPIPNQMERKEILEFYKIPKDQSEELAKETSGFTATDLRNLSLNKTINVKELRKCMQDSICIPDTKWADIGGLESIKRNVMDTFLLPLHHPELFNSQIKKRSGILLFGPPGNGKTLLAKAVANECSLNFIPVKGPELLNMYVGESEANVRSIFQKARQNRPCIIFFDEIDAIAPSRGYSNDAGGVMDRVVSQLLSELDSLSQDDLFVMAATNRPDSSLMRPGRFDKSVYVGLPESNADKIHVLKSSLSKLKVDKIDFEYLADCCPPLASSADLSSICKQASLLSIERLIKEIDKSFHEHKIYHPEASLDEFIVSLPLDKVQAIVNQEDLIQSAKNLVPSLSQNEYSRYKSLQNFNK
ncbi:AAA-domain-containing protein [Rozella allomycis CSF55]|uniref:Peroxisomal ATPase PEX6 n=1 Tax=Rozella allomycis (strain CSF55) TaxID=988480 RepID=A0A4P9YRC8_ROZAC|nr:AAA-domain-containing protein [Rozella allomycis CSF55]